MNKKKYLIIAGIVVAAVILAILLDAMLANHMPAITSLEVEPDIVFPWGSCQIACNASDLDGDELSYEWSATEGEINGEGGTVTWTAPGSAGSYNVTVTVTDGRGGEDIGKLSLSVNVGNPPTIEKLVVTPNGHTYLRKSGTPGWACDVWIKKEYDIECIASDTGKLVYDWSCDDGQISEVSEDGATIAWTAPNERSIEVTITVVVSDVYGHSMANSAIFHVASCTCGTWGLKSLEISF